MERLAFIKQIQFRHFKWWRNIDGQQMGIQMSLLNRVLGVRISDWMGVKWIMRNMQETEYSNEENSGSKGKHTGLKKKGVPLSLIP